MAPSLKTMEDAVECMERMKKSLPPRPNLDQLEAAHAVILKFDKDLATQLKSLSNKPRPHHIPSPVFQALLHMRRDVLINRANEAKRTALALLQLEERHLLYSNLIHTAKSTVSNESTFIVEPQHLDGRVPPTPTELESGIGPLPSPQEQELEEANAFEDSLPSISRSMSLPTNLLAENAPSNDVDMPPHINFCISGLLATIETAQEQEAETLDLHGYEIFCIPRTIGALANLAKLDLSCNQIHTLPESIGNLSKLTVLELGNNKLTHLPDSIGKLTCLEKLNIEKNSLEELPLTIGSCKALIEINTDFNRLKALPESLGRLTCLRSLSVHLNSRLPLTTQTETHDLPSMTNPIHLADRCFDLPESSTDFSTLETLPESIGELRNLEYLDISYNKITVLPDSFALLTNLKNLSLEGNPLKVPPLEIANQGRE